MAACPQCGCLGCAILLEVHCINEHCKLYDPGEPGKCRDTTTGLLNGDHPVSVYKSLKRFRRLYVDRD